MNGGFRAQDPKSSGGERDYSQILLQLVQRLCSPKPFDMHTASNFFPKDHIGLDILTVISRWKDAAREKIEDKDRTIKTLFEKSRVDKVEMKEEIKNMERRCDSRLANPKSDVAEQKHKHNDLQVNAGEMQNFIYLQKQEIQKYKEECEKLKAQLNQQLEENKRQKLKLKEQSTQHSRELTPTKSRTYNITNESKDVAYSDEYRRTLRSKTETDFHRNKKSVEPTMFYTDESAIAFITEKQTYIKKALDLRSTNLQTVRAMWKSGNTKTAIDSAISMNDQAVIVNVMDILNAKPGLWSLDVFCRLLLYLKELLASDNGEYVRTACESLKILLNTFGPLVKTYPTIKPTESVNVASIECVQKCKLCYQGLIDIRSMINKRAYSSGKSGGPFGVLQILLNKIE